MTADKLAQLYVRATLLWQGGDTAGAQQILKKILLAKPNHAGALLRQGEIALSAGETDRALGLVRKAAGFGKTDPDLLCEAGNLLLGAGQAEEALAAFEAALALVPEEPPFLIDRGNALAALRRWPEALAAYDASIALVPENAVAHYNRGNALLRMGRPDEALAAHDRAVAWQPIDPNARMNRAESLAALGRREEALAELDAALKLAPGNPRIEWNRALLLLQLGRFEAGWAAYEARKRGHPPVGLFATDKPEWDGKASLAGKTLLLHWEQGFGDTIQVCRYARLAKAAGARVVLQVQAPLKRLIATLDPDIQVVADGDPLPAFDLHAPLMSLPGAFATIPAETPYLFTEAAPSPKGPHRRAGLVWRGAPGHAGDLSRSLDRATLEALLALPVDWTVLSPDLTAEERALVAANGARAAEGLADFADTAAVIAGLDLVVSVDTSVAHLAGALGKPVLVLLPFHPDWRWLLGREDSPWYPTARLIRQPAPGDWAPVVEAVRAALG